MNLPPEKGTGASNDKGVDPATPFQTHKVLKLKLLHEANQEDGISRLTARIAALNSPKVESGKTTISEELPPENDAGNAQLFLEEFGKELRFVPALNCWLSWGGTRWKRDEDGEVQRFAVRLSQLLMKNASQIVDHNQRTVTARRGIGLGNFAKIKSMLEVAKCNARIVVRHSRLDSDPWLLGVENGVIELQTGTYRVGRREDFVTKVAGCAYDSTATAPRWLQFLHEIFSGDELLIAYVGKLVGYTLTGITREQMFPFLHGEGANGKTTFIETITALLGDYGQRAPQTLLVACNNGHEPMNEIARLHGMRFVVGSETREGERLAEGRIKDMTGGDTMTGRFLYREAFDFVPTLKLWMFGNHRPEIRGADYGIWRRVRLIPFKVRIEERVRDHSLQNKLREELPGILNWAIQGCLCWQRDGLKAPDPVEIATAEYRDDEDVLRDFLAEETDFDNESRVPHAEMYKRYSDWCGRSGVRAPMQSRTFSRRLSDRGCRRERTGKGVRWAGIKLK